MHAPDIIANFLSCATVAEWMDIYIVYISIYINIYIYISRDIHVTPGNSRVHMVRWSGNSSGQLCYYNAVPS